MSVVNKTIHPSILFLFLLNKPISVGSIYPSIQYRSLYYSIYFVLLFHTVFLILSFFFLCLSFFLSFFHSNVFNTSFTYSCLPIILFHFCFLGFFLNNFIRLFVLFGQLLGFPVSDFSLIDSFFLSRPKKFIYFNIPFKAHVVLQYT